MVKYPTFEDFPNFNGIAAACNLTLPQQCDAYSSAPQSVSTKVSGDCNWVLKNKDAVATVKNDTAKVLGVAPASLTDFSVTGPDGQVCKASKAKHHRMTTLQATAGLTANFKVVARDNATAARIAASANAKPIMIPAVQQAATQTAQVAKNAEIAKNVTTLPPKTAAPGKTLPATPKPTMKNTTAPTIAPKNSAMAIAVPAAMLAALAVLLL